MNRRYSLIIGALIVIFVTIVLTIISSTIFHLISTSPTNNYKKSGTADVIHFRFNKPLDKSMANNFSISPEVAGKVAINDKELTFTPTGRYVVTTTYTATLKKPRSASGSTTSDAKISFTINLVDYTALSKQQQQDGTNQNDPAEPPYSAGSVAVIPDDSLIQLGVTAKEVKNLETAFYLYATSTKKQIRNIKMSNIDPVPYDRYSPSTVHTINFTASLDGLSTVKTRFDYDSFTSAHIILSNPSTGAQLFDSGIVNTK